MTEDPGRRDDDETSATAGSTSETGVRSRTPLRARIEPVLGGSAVVEDLEVARGDAPCRGVALQDPGPGDDEWTVVDTSGEREPVTDRGSASASGAEWRSNGSSPDQRSRLVYERLDAGRWRRTMLRSSDGGATWSELWRDELRPEP